MINSTNFANLVWRALKLIPKGRVTTYQAIAKYLNKPKAARAVGNACGRNPDAPAVPCHRVVRSDGGLGGYSGGVKKKIELLKKEGVGVRGDKIINFEKMLFNYN